MKEINIKRLLGALADIHALEVGIATLFNGSNGAPAAGDIIETIREEMRLIPPPGVGSKKVRQEIVSTYMDVFCDLQSRDQVDAAFEALKQVSESVARLQLEHFSPTTQPS